MRSTSGSFGANMATSGALRLFCLITSLWIFTDFWTFFNHGDSLTISVTCSPIYDVIKRNAGLLKNDDVKKMAHSVVSLIDDDAMCVTARGGAWFEGVFCVIAFVIECRSSELQTVSSKPESPAKWYLRLSRSSKAFISQKYPSIRRL